jgi:3'-phosphoadenosine 5'-phosphosulfate sulfotransferase (PAPS reductase)/FAD synthetase
LRYAVSLSGGLASAVSADRAIARYGRENVALTFADTHWEDEDLYRFLLDLERRWGGSITRLSDGRTPLQVAEDKQIIPNSQIAPCSHELKVKLLDALDAATPKPLTRLLGLDWREQDRVGRMKKRYESRAALEWYVDFPLLWKPLEFRPYAEVVRSWGIAVPRLYLMGFSHNNCGGRCVKQGMAEWMRLKRYFPERFAEVRDWELAQRAKGGARATFAISKDRTGGESHPLTLAALEERELPREGTPMLDDMFSCFCGDGEVA